MLNIKELLEETDETNDLFITTIDNPNDYFTKFEEWLAFDTEKGYGTLQYIGRIAESLFPEVFSSNLNKKQINEILFEIVRLNPLQYKLISNKDSND